MTPKGCRLSRVHCTSASNQSTTKSSTRKSTQAALKRTATWLLVQALVIAAGRHIYCMATRTYSDSHTHMHAVYVKATRVYNIMPPTKYDNWYQKSRSTVKYGQGTAIVVSTTAVLQPRTTRARKGANGGAGGGGGLPNTCDGRLPGARAGLTWQP